MTLMTSFRFMVTCADGLEAPLLTELAAFGMVGERLKVGRVLVTGGVRELYQLCLYSRVASRVLLPIGEYHFKKQSKTIITPQSKSVITEDIPEVLYEFVKRIDWTQIFGLEQTFAIRMSVDKRVAVNQQFATLRVKDAIADSFKERLGSRPNVDKSPDFLIYVHIGVDSAELAIDLSGGSLHRRGYRLHNTEAPLKENLAAALLYECGWHTGEFDVLIDPMCGSGTFVIEAALMSLGYPVGIEKAQTGFGFYGWQHHDDTLWQQMVNDAMDTFHETLNTSKLPAFFAMDADLTAIKSTHKNMMSSALAPIADQVSLTHQPLSKLCDTLKSMTVNHVLLITNPPYGERLGDEMIVKPLYQGLGLIAKDNLPKGSYLGVLAGRVEEADLLPIQDPATLRCHNGALTVYFRHGKIKSDDTASLIERFEKTQLAFDTESVLEFVNRLQKNLSVLKKHAKKDTVSNLRIYDADLPNFNVAIDLYGDKVHIQEYAPPKTIDPATAKERFNLALMATRQVLGVNREDIFIKTRARQSGAWQYTKQSSTGRRYVVREHGAYVYVNFTDYLDTGLFIDHRIMRGIIGQASFGKSVLNLFAYTCTASLQAAMNGAKSVTSVDLSANYLDWGRCNFALNGLVLDDRYQFIAHDVFDWIKENRDKYDVIFIDPPTFSKDRKSVV